MFLTIEAKYHQLKKYTHNLKNQLKLYSGESVKKGGTIERKFKVYKKLRKLSHYFEENKNNADKIKEIENQLNIYYDLLYSKIEKINSSKNVKNKVLVSNNNNNNNNNEKLNKVMKKEEEIVYSDNEKDSKGNINYESQDIYDGMERDNDDDDDDEHNDNSNEKVTEIGPTPQLSGRVLTIFDIETSPENFMVSPIKGKKRLDLNININNNENQDEIFKTPSKRKRNSDNERNYLSSTSKKLSFDLGNTTPVKNIDRLKEEIRVIETPKYLRQESKNLKNVDEIIIGEYWSEDELDNKLTNNNDDDYYDLLNNNLNNINIDNLPDIDEKIVEPSPIIKKRGRSLFELHNDFVGLKRNLTDLEEIIDSNEIKENIDNNLTDKVDIENQAADEEKELIENVFDPHFKLRKKMKTIKRSTKRSKLRTDKLELNDELDKINIHQLAFGSKILKDDLDGDLNTEKGERKEEQDRSDDDDDDDDHYIRKDIKQLEKELNIGKSKSKGKHPLSNNFVRLKINNKRGRFKRR